ncbi:MAG: ABC transporter ATP-binding protein [Deltaproteobacteria bacterium]|nr:ABC transporter ATP-binding protein [Deltaproteobacteria bacterium]
MLLRIKGLQAFIGEFHILQGVDLDVNEGEIVVLLGRNGSGKTTTLRCIMGLVPSTAIEYEGNNIAGLPPYTIASRGISLVPEDQGIFSTLTVAENMRVAMQGSLKECQKSLDFILSIFPDLQLAWNRKAGGLSGGQKQMLAVARGMINKNKLLMLDEPSKGLAPVVVNELGKVLQELKKHTSILLVEQNVTFSKKIGDRFSILSDGKTVASGPMAELEKNMDLQHKYLGVSTT